MKVEELTCVLVGGGRLLLSMNNDSIVLSSRGKDEVISAELVRVRSTLPGSSSAREGTGYTIYWSLRRKQGYYKGACDVLIILTRLR